MANLEHYIKKVYNHAPKYPGRSPEGRLFPDSPEAPQLIKARTNRVIIYNGSFNPPHRGHLNLLQHIFYHGVHDLNVVGAIIRPLGDSYSIGKGQKAGGSFVFDRDTRCMLWKQDLSFPDWAWVHEGGDSFSGFADQLKEAAGEDGYKIEYLPLKGPWEDEHKSPQGPDDFGYGATTLIICDAARPADYQRSSGNIRDFKGYSKWTLLYSKHRPVTGLTQTRLQLALGRHDIVHRGKRSHVPHDNDNDVADNWSTCADDGGDATDREVVFVDPVTYPGDRSMEQDFRNIIQCQYSAKWQAHDRKHKIRFVKTRSRRQVKRSTDTSSTELRDVMSNSKTIIDLQTSLRDLALSGGLLWECKDQWMEKAKYRSNDLISLTLPNGWSQKRHQMKNDLLELATCKFLRVEVPMSRAKTMELPKDYDASKNKTPKKKRKRASSVPVPVANSTFKRRKLNAQDNMAASKQSAIWGRCNNKRLVRNDEGPTGPQKIMNQFNQERELPEVIEAPKEDGLPKDDGSPAHDGPLDQDAIPNDDGEPNNNSVLKEIEIPTQGGALEQDEPLGGDEVPKEVQAPEENDPHQENKVPGEDKPPIEDEVPAPKADHMLLIPIPNCHTGLPEP
ncbi:MAG: hypothetical protein Q9218_005721 [Villophora microphyllina]